MENNRRNPDKILGAIQKNELQKRKGKLRIFLGMCPGVGKTYAMLLAAKVQKERNVDVVIGVVESHGREDTINQSKDLEIIEKRKINYKDTILYEMDLDAVLTRKPQLVLVDELAHTNAVGSRHLKRYQDVEEILDQGIDVYTTLNIQHIESRNDQVAQITGVFVREMVPDSFLETATQIEVIDLNPLELLNRLREGKVYLNDRIKIAEENFFKEEQLLALRELALRFTAEKVDQDLLQQMAIKGIEGPWNTNERLLVAVSHSPYSMKLVRSTRRMAYNLESPWIALYVNNGEILSGDDQKSLSNNLAHAKELGAEVLTVYDNDILNAIQKICDEKNVTQIVMGRPDRRFLLDVFRGGNLLDHLVNKISNIDLHVIRAERPPKFTGWHLSLPEFKSGFLKYYNTIWFLVIVSLLCDVALPFVGYRALGSVFLLAILIVSSLADRGPIFFAAIFSALVWNYFFIPPRYTFIINSTEDLMMVFTFFVVALLAGFLTSRKKKQEEVLEKKEQTSRRLYEFSKKLANSLTIEEINEYFKNILEKEFESEIIVLIKNEKDLLTQPSSYVLDEKDFAVATWAYDQKKVAGWSTHTLSQSNFLCVPMRGNDHVVGVVMLKPKNKKNIIMGASYDFLESVISLTSIAIERKILREELQEAKIFEASEKLHQTILNSVSHELRTPITTIIGTASALMENINLEAKQSLANELILSAKRLDRVVENLLDVSRLEKGALTLKKEWFDIADLIAEAISTFNIDDYTFEFKSNISILVEADYKLILHALVNIFSNAIKYSPIHSLIQIKIETQFKNGLLISIIDEGPGIPAESLKLVFEKFYRLPSSPTGGIGLGLSIVKNIMELHSGSVTCFNRSDRTGTIFVLKLPIPPLPNLINEAIK